MAFDKNVSYGRFYPALGYAKITDIRYNGFILKYNLGEPKPWTNNVSSTNGRLGTETECFLGTRTAGKTETDF